MGKTRPENNHVYPSLNLSPHKTRQRSQPLLILLLSLPHFLTHHIILLGPLIKFKRRLVVVPRVTGAKLGEEGREVPPLEYLLVDVVAVVATQEGL